MKTLHLVGMPMHEEGLLHPEAVSLLSRVNFAIGENRKPTFPYLRRSKVTLKDEQIFFLDTPNQEEMAREELKKLTAGEVALFSDSGMPVLFDPGASILEYARTLGYEIRSCPSAQSWATACAVCGFEPPFFLEGFLPQKSEARAARLQQLKKMALEANLILMETPYRFEKILTELNTEVGAKAHAFIAWEIASPAEAYFWGTLGQCVDWAKRTGRTKGEFVIILKRAPGKPKTSSKS